MDIELIDVKSIFVNKAHNRYMRLTNGYISNSCDMVIANWLMRAKDSVENFDEDYKNNLSVIANVLRYGK